MELCIHYHETAGHLSIELDSRTGIYVGQSVEGSGC